MPVCPGVTEELNKLLRKTNFPREAWGYKYYRCPVCFKEFSTHRGWEWSYKIKTRGILLMFCGYTCLQHAKKIVYADHRRKENKEDGLQKG